MSINAEGMTQAALAAMGESSGDFPPGKFGTLWCRKSVLKPVVGQNVRF